MSSTLYTFSPRTPDRLVDRDNPLVRDYIDHCSVLQTDPLPEVALALSDSKPAAISFSHRKRPLTESDVLALSETLRKTDRVAQLNFESHPLGNASVAALLRSLCENKSLSGLNLSGTRLNLQYGQLLGQCFSAGCPIEDLVLDKCGITDEVLSSFVSQLMRSSHIKKLSLSGNTISAAGTEELAALCVFTKLERLNLCFNRCESAGASRLGVCLANPACKLRDLDLGSCGIGDDGIPHIATGLSTNATLLKLNLRSNLITSVGASLLAKAMETNRSLRELYLGSNRIDTGGCLALASMLCVNAVLERLDLQGVKLGAESSLAIADALRVNTTLSHLILDVEQQTATSKAGAALADAIRMNTTLTDLQLLGMDVDETIQNTLRLNRIAAGSSHQRVTTQDDMNSLLELITERIQGLESKIAAEKDPIKVAQYQKSLELQKKAAQAIRSQLESNASAEQNDEALASDSMSASSVQLGKVAELEEQLAQEVLRRRTLEEQLIAEQNRADEALALEKKRAVLAEIQTQEEKARVAGMQRQLDAERSRLELLENRLNKQAERTEALQGDLFAREEVVRKLENQLEERERRITESQASIDSLHHQLADIERNTSRTLEKETNRAQEAERQYAAIVDALHLAEFDLAQDKHVLRSLQEEVDAERHQKDKLQVLLQDEQHKAQMLQSDLTTERQLEEEIRSKLVKEQQRAVSLESMLQTERARGEDLENRLSRVESAVEVLRTTESAVSEPHLDSVLHSRVIPQIHKVLDIERKRLTDDFHGRLTNLQDRLFARVETDRMDVEVQRNSLWEEFCTQQAAGYQDVVEDIRTLMAAFEKISTGQEAIVVRVEGQESHLDSLTHRLNTVEETTRVSARSLETLQKDCAADFHRLREHIQSTLVQGIDQKLSDTLIRVSSESSAAVAGARRITEDLVSKSITDLRDEMAKERTDVWTAIRDDMAQQMRIQTEATEQSLRLDLQDLVRRETTNGQRKAEALIKKQQEMVDRLSDESRWVQEESIRARVDEESRLREQISELKQHVDAQVRNALASASRDIVDSVEKKLQDVDRRSRSDDTQKWSVNDVRIQALTDKCSSLEKTVRALQRALDIFRNTPLAESSSNPSHPSHVTSPGSALHRSVNTSGSFDVLADRLSMLESTVRKDQSASLLALESILHDKDRSRSQNMMTTPFSSKKKGGY
eukprot:ANDGO_02031.mRNA.1 FERM domain-containing protein C